MFFAHFSAPQGPQDRPEGSQGDPGSLKGAPGSAQGDPGGPQGDWFGGLVSRFLTPLSLYLQGSQGLRNTLYCCFVFCAFLLKLTCFFLHFSAPQGSQNRPEGSQGDPGATGDLWEPPGVPRVTLEALRGTGLGPWFRVS